MTAYVNDEQKKEGAYGKAVKATLAATLAAGMVPAAAAFAEEPAEAAEGNDVELLANPSAAEAFSAGEAKGVYAYVDGKVARSFTVGKDALTASKGDSKMVVPTKVTVPSIGDVTIVTSATSGNAELVVDPDFKVSVYAADKDGNPTGEALSETINPGNYVTVVEAVDGDYKGGKVCVPFTINAADLRNLSVFEVNPSDATNDDDVYFEFTGDKLNLGIVANGAILEQGVDYEVTFKKAASNEAADVIAAGSYYAEVKGLGIYAGKEGKTAAFTVNKFNLASATVQVDDVIGTNAVPTKANRIVSNNGTVLNPEMVTIALNAGQVFDAPGAYKFTASATDAANIDGTNADVVVNKIARAASFSYDDEAWKTEFVTDLSQKKPVYFDLNDVAVFDGDSKLDRTVSNAAGKYKVEVYNAAGDEVSADIFKDGNTKLNVPGTYTVKVFVVTGEGNYNVGGAVYSDVKVTKGAIDADATAWVSYGGKVVEGNELDAEFDPKGGYAVNDFKFGVKDANGKDVATSDYTVKIVDQDGKEYKAGDTMKNAGTYSIVIESTAYDITNQTAVEFTIAPMALDNIKLGVVKQFEDSAIYYAPLKKEGYGLPYVAGTNWSLDIQRNNGTEYKALEENSELKLTLEQYDAEAGVWKTVTTAKGEGECRVTVAPLNSSVASNYKFATEAGTVVDFRVVDESKLKFYDVPPAEWYFDNIATAVDKNWIKGYNNTKFFGPNDAITRADVCVIMARMAGKDLWIDRPENSGSEMQFFETPFGDVNGKMYYAEAVAWAANTGIVKGDSNTGAFRPDDQISREEFAAMMARYSEKLGNDVTADASVLDDYADASSVSAWAKDYVAWAVEEGIMGVDTTVLWPSEDITRAAVATMLVRL